MKVLDSQTLDLGVEMDSFIMVKNTHNISECASLPLRISIIIIFTHTGDGLIWHGW